MQTLRLALTALALCAGQEPKASPPDPAQAVQFQPDPAWKPLGRDLWFDPAGKVLILRARTAITEGYLEHLLCLEQTKEHESILATWADPRMIHAGLILAVGEPGKPVRYRPEFRPPEGPEVAIEVEWHENGKLHRVDAREWVKNSKTGNRLESNWVFAGSELFQDPDTKKMVYAADGGDLITVANFPSAILDLPFASSNSDAERSYVAFAGRIPARGTPVTVYLRKAAPAGQQPAP
ncbi:MAG: hypothetical protein KatS3mg108_1692 [Isosphaeraceae bacterium]|jgi:hypothetical protein|nr:MAG: hypothetical protein KatS3mg108_1692 [Isosphaeraceae bacterium]